MITLAEISDKIWLPSDMLMIGLGIGVIVYLLALFAGMLGKVFIFVVTALGLLSVSWLLIAPIDADLVDSANREIPMYLLKMRVSLIAPILIGGVMAWWSIHIIERNQLRKKGRLEIHKYA